MRVVVAGEQISFFERFGYLELESFFTEKETAHLASAVEEEMERRKKKSPSALLDDPSLLYGYDLAVSCEKIRKELFSLRLAKAAFSLVRKKPLRYAFDTFWKIPEFSISSSLEDISSVTPLLISAVIALESQRDEVAAVSVPFEYRSFPQHKGSVAFIASKTVITTSSSFPGRYLVIAYSAGQLMYRLQSQDPNTHFLKRYGYVFGDTLKETTHPVLFR